MKQILSRAFIGIICAIPVVLILYFNISVALRVYLSLHLPSYGERIQGKVIGKQTTSWRNDTYRLKISYDRHALSYSAEIEVDAHRYRVAEVEKAIDLFIDKANPRRFVVAGDETYMVDTVKAGFADILLIIATVVVVRLWRKSRAGQSYVDSTRSRKSI